MFDALRGFLSNLATPVASRRHFDENDHRLAAVALLIHVADSDGDFDKQENQRLREIIKEKFELDAGTAIQLVRDALKSDREAVGIDHFVNILKRVLDESGRLKLVEMIWDIVFADGEANETEESIVWRIAAMFGIGETDLETLRRSRSPGHWPDTSS